MTIRDIPVFTTEECHDITARLESLRGRWIRRNGFFTFGVATYLDVNRATAPEESYYGRLGEWNALLMLTFGRELEAVRSALEGLDEPARYDPRVALPGFHIFEERGIPTSDLPSAHFDNQFRALRWPFSIAPGRTLSFTLAIKLPASGGGLDVWDVTDDEVRRLERLGRRVSTEELTRLKPMRRHEYAVGCLAVQTIGVLHRIGGIERVEPGDQRITLQGHAVWDGEAWVLYW